MAKVPHKSKGFGFKYIFFGICILIVIFLVSKSNSVGSNILRHAVNFRLFKSVKKEVIYPFVDRGDVSIANKILRNQYEISRFKPVMIDNITWDEDPYTDIYWRFNFYNLEPVRNLLYAWVKTNDPKYKNKMVEITESFIDNGLNGKFSWDYHGVAFRTMTLIDVREKLLKKKQLSSELDKKILNTLKIQGDFLADPTHFEEEFNHGVDQAAALYLLAINYPKMTGADSWLVNASERISTMLTNVIDNDGVLVENSPYYHLYVLEKFWNIKEYLNQNNLTINGFSEEKINKMISYVVYMLQPDLSVPTIGASLKQQINLFGIYNDMTIDHPDLLYVLTKGAKGTKPTNLNIRFEDSGQTIMRSGWGKNNKYENQTQLIFDVGNYRTNHSDLDALSFNLFGSGIALMPDAGLFTYESGPYRSYFHGTRAHNTVIVDGKDQLSGEMTHGTSKKVFPGDFVEGEGYVYQSGESELYPGVSHSRAIAMIENSTVLIFDNLKSSSEHNYEQMFHLFPGAVINTEGLNLIARDKNNKQVMAIRQFVSDGVNINTTIGKSDPIDGQCSFEYKIATPCHSVSYSQKGNNVSYVTVIDIGPKKSNIDFNKDKKMLVVTTANGKYTMKVNQTEGIERTIEVDKKFDVSTLYSTLKPVVPSANVSGWRENLEDGVAMDNSTITTNNIEKSVTINVPTNGKYVEIAKDINLDLSNKNLYFKVKIGELLNLNGFDIYLSNNNWSKYVSFNVTQITHYQAINRKDEWIQFGVGKGQFRKARLGNWKWSDPIFDWSKIDGIKFITSSNGGKKATISIKDFILVPDQKVARALFVFDDGWLSVNEASRMMASYGYKGNVAMITDSVGKKSYLSLNDLKVLQNDLGWNIVSHSSLHRNAVLTYMKNSDYEGLDIDVGDALEYLVNNNLNSAPNWYVYPDGGTNSKVKQIIGKYYKFARATEVGPQLFPFAEPLEVAVFPVYSDRATPLDVHNAIRDAIKYKQTIILMFHKLSNGTPTAYTEIPVNDFDKILKDISKQGIKVVTFSELDSENGIPQTEFVINSFEPPQIILEIVKDDFNIFKKAWNRVKE